MITATTQVYTLPLHDALPIFPAVTTKRLAFKSAMGELVGFLRGASSAADFRALGCKVWDQNAKDRKSTRLNSSHVKTSYAVLCLKTKTQAQVLLAELCAAVPA